MLKKQQLVIVSPSTTILEVMEKMNIFGISFAIITSDGDNFLGLVTDGDIRRSFISGVDNNRSIDSIMNNSPVTVEEEASNEVMKNLLNDKFKYIPVLDKKNCICGVLSHTDKSVSIDVKNRKICVLGLGYVGLTLSLVMADVGFKVYGYDTNKDLIKKISDGSLSFFEDGIDMYLNRHVHNNLTPISSLQHIDVDTYIITVGTPINENTKTPRIDYIEKAIESIAKYIKQDDLIILRSTVPVGTTRRIVLPILQRLSRLDAGKDYYLAYAPERTIEGAALNEIRSLPQVVGGYDLKSKMLAEQLFRELTNTIIEVPNLESAEMVKIMNNTFRDVKFAYANEMALICKELGLDMVKLVDAANMGYTRDKIPVPSPGVGGACLSKDSYILSYSTKDIKTKPEIIERSRYTNELIPRYIADELVTELGLLSKNIRRAKIFIIGFAFKGQPETSDMRGSTTLDLLEYLRNNDANKNSIYGYDPVVEQPEIEELGVKYASLENGFDEADVVIIMNNHKSYHNMDIYSLLERSSNNLIFFDGWHLFDPSDIVGVSNRKYVGVGCKC